MRRAEVERRLQAGEELVYGTIEGRVRIGHETIHWPQFMALRYSGNITLREYRDHHEYYRWSGPTPAAGTGKDVPGDSPAKSE